MNDDYMFPVTRTGLERAGMLLESAASAGGSGNTGEDAVAEAARSTARAAAMSALLSWIAAGDYSYDALDEAVIVVADLDGDFAISEEEEDYYNRIWAEMGDALLSLGVGVQDAQTLVDGPGKDADDAAVRAGRKLSDALDEERADDDSLIAGFALGEDALLESIADDTQLHGIMEATYKNRKVVRDGQVIVERKRVSGTTRQSAEQKLALRKARSKAHSAAANLKRRKSMRLRQNRGL